MASRSTPLPRLVAVAVAAIVAAVAFSCSSSSDAGAGFELRASQVTESTTTTAPKPQYQTEVATANVPKLEVLAEKPGDPASATVVFPGTHPPIPRIGFASAGATKTDQGWVYDNPTYFGNPLVMVVTENDGDWLKVMIPARPNQQQGWVKASDVTLSDHEFHGELKLSERKLTIWNGNDVVTETPVVVGKDSTPTPQGRLYIAEKIQQSYAGGAYGPWVLATNAYSESVDLFDGGLPIIAFHGTNQPGLIGSAASNGCIRMPNDVDNLLAMVLPVGTPIDVVA